MKRRSFLKAFMGAVASVEILGAQTLFAGVENDADALNEALRAGFTGDTQALKVTSLEAKLVSITWDQKDLTPWVVNTSLRDFNLVNEYNKAQK